MEEIEDIKKEASKEPAGKSAEELLVKSLKLIVIFYGKLLIWLLIIFSIFSLIYRVYNINLILVFIIIFLGSLFIAFIAQISNYFVENSDNAKENKFKDFSVQSEIDCFIRCTSGFFEMIFYTIFFATNLGALVIGYLIVKTISVWKIDKPDKDKPDNLYANKKSEGLHTGVLRIAIVFSLIFSLIASYFLFKYLQSSPNIFNITNLNSYSIFK